MKRIFQSLLFSAFTLFTSTLLAGDTELNLYSWSEYFPKPVLEGFTAKTGIKVNLIIFSSNEELLEKISSGVVSYDLIVPSDYAVELLIARKQLRKIDRTKIANFKNLDPAQMKLPYDKENEFSIPYFWGTTGLAINREVIKDPVDSWSVVFDPKNSGKICMLNDARENFAVALKMMGKSINETDSNTLKQAAQMLTKQTKLVKAYDSDSFEDKLRTGEAAIVQGFNGQLAKVIRENKTKFYFVVPKEGAVHWVDNLAIPNVAKHTDAAHAFLNYILEPQIGADIVKAVGYASANTAAKQFIAAEILNDTNIYATEDVMKRCEVMSNIGKAATQVDKLWTRLKSQ